MYPTRSIAALILSLLLFASAHAQAKEHEGIQLYKKGKVSEAETVLAAAVKSDPHRSNADLWNYLGLSRLALNDAKSARKALETAVKLAPTNSVYQANLAFAWLRLENTDRARQEATRAIGLDPNNATAYYVRGAIDRLEGRVDDADRNAQRVLELDPEYALAYILRSDILLGRLTEKLTRAGIQALPENIWMMKDAQDLLRTGTERVPPANRYLIEAKLNTLKAFYDYLTNERFGPGNPKPAPEPGVTPEKVLATAKASYTDKARAKDINGSIHAAILLGASGRVESVLLLTRLGYGLDENVLAAARSIRFEPKKKDGKPVPSVIIREYTFTIF